MADDFVARLGSRALRPTEIRTAWDVEAYAGLLDPDSEAGRRVDRLTNRGARAIRRVDPARMRAVLTALADPPSAELNHAELARLAGMPATTIGPYVDVLVELGAICLLPATRAPLAKRVVARPRTLLTDVAIAAHLRGLAAGDLAAFAGRSTLAGYLKAMVSLELLRQQPCSPIPYRVGHLRERNGLAVDLVIEIEDGSIFGIEVRTASSVRPHQFARLSSLAARAGTGFRAGIVLNTATSGHRYRPDLWGLPISTLWDQTASGPPGFGVQP